MLMQTTNLDFFLQNNYKSLIQDMSYLKECLVKAWSAVEQCVADKATDEWHICLHCYVSANSRHFKRKSWCFQSEHCVFTDVVLSFTTAEMPASHTQWEASVFRC